MLSTKTEPRRQSYLQEDGFAASLVEGVWYEALLYGSYDMEEFFAVTDESECLAILSTARKALEVYSPGSPGDGLLT